MIRIPRPTLQLALLAALAREVEALLATLKPDVMTLDINMPEMDGVEFMAAQKANSKISSIPVILLSGIAEEAKNVRPFGRVQKPFAMAALSKAISDVFESLGLS